MAVIVKLYVVALAVAGAVPDNEPLLLNVEPVGNVPLANTYVIGASPVAVNVALILPASYAVPKLPALVVQFGVPL